MGAHGDVEVTGMSLRQRGSHQRRRQATDFVAETQAEAEPTSGLLDFEMPSLPGNEHIAIARVREALGPRQVEPATVDRITTAVAEATVNAIEHGNNDDPGLTVRIEVRADPDAVVIRVSDRGGGPADHEPEEPDLNAKLEGLQSPRGWGLLLIRNMVDDLRVTTADGYHTLELTVETSKEAGDAEGRRRLRLADT